ncbi:MAG: hypothetical protein KGR26_12580 [Cyanobacteria bacterium REEB65]|nr:hypothetical protein [Cyanobacteria bacterium REEB65]
MAIPETSPEMIKGIRAAPGIDKGARAATATGIVALLTSAILMFLCCWAPALILALGLTSLYGALYGYRYLFGAAGAALVAGGLLWAWQKRRHGACACDDGDSK